jgi:hypothetical protein
VTPSGGGGVVGVAGRGGWPVGPSPLLRSTTPASTPAASTCFPFSEVPLHTGPPSALGRPSPSPAHGAGSASAAFVNPRGSVGSGTGLGLGAAGVGMPSGAGAAAGSAAPPSGTPSPILDLVRSGKRLSDALFHANFQNQLAWRQGRGGECSGCGGPCAAHSPFRALCPRVRTMHAHLFSPGCAPGRPRCEHVACGQARLGAAPAAAVCRAPPPRCQWAGTAHGPRPAA